MAWSRDGLPGLGRGGGAQRFLFECLDVTRPLVHLIPELEKNEPNALRAPALRRGFAYQPSIGQIALGDQLVFHVGVLP